MLTQLANLDVHANDSLPFKSMFHNMDQDIGACSCLCM